MPSRDIARANNQTSRKEVYVCAPLSTGIPNLIAEGSIIVVFSRMIIRRGAEPMRRYKEIQNTTVKVVRRTMESEREAERQRDRERERKPGKTGRDISALATECCLRGMLPKARETQVSTHGPFCWPPKFRVLHILTRARTTRIHSHKK